MTGILTAVATGLQVVSAISGARAQSNAANYNAEVAAQNAGIANDQANSSAEQQRISNLRKIGAIKAGYGASGVTSDGSPMDVLGDSYTQGEYDVQNILYQGKLKAAGYTNDASLDKSQASNAISSGYVNAASSALLGTSKTIKAFST